MKTCSRCGESKTYDEFYARRSASDGRKSWCKPCANADRQQWAANNPGRGAEHARRWHRQHPEQIRLARRGHNAVYYAITHSILTRPSTCEQCAGPGPIEAAHHDYTKPLDVRWLCRSCHRRWDAQQPKLVGVAA